MVKRSRVVGEFLVLKFFNSCQDIYIPEPDVESITQSIIQVDNISANTVESIICLLNSLIYLGQSSNPEK